jgi:hypothetical protein
MATIEYGDKGLFKAFGLVAKNQAMKLTRVKQSNQNRFG